MQNVFKKVAKLFFIIISKIFITRNMNCNETLCTSQQQIAVDDEKLHYIRRKIVTSSKRIKTSTLRRKAPVPSRLQEGNIEREKTVTKKAFSFVTFKWI